jgi:hypothetical protein
LVVRAADLHGPLRRIADLDTVRIGERTLRPQLKDTPIRARIYAPAGMARQTVLLVSGLHPAGIDEPRLVALARRLAEADVIVVTPEISGDDLSLVRAHHALSFQTGEESIDSFLDLGHRHVLTIFASREKRRLVDEIREMKFRLPPASVPSTRNGHLRARRCTSFQPITGFRISSGWRCRAARSSSGQVPYLSGGFESGLGMTSRGEPVEAIARRSGAPPASSRTRLTGQRPRAAIHARWHPRRRVERRRDISRQSGGFAVGQFDVVRPLQRPGAGWIFQFNLTPGF